MQTKYHTRSYKKKIKPNIGVTSNFHKDTLSKKALFNDFDITYVVTTMNTKHIIIYTNTIIIDDDNMIKETKIYG